MDREAGLSLIRNGGISTAGRWLVAPPDGGADSGERDERETVVTRMYRGAGKALPWKRAICCNRPAREREVRPVSATNSEAKVEVFRTLHEGPRLLVLPNAWDAAVARVFQDAGFDAVATTSAGIAFSLGYPDGERIGREEMLDAAARIVAAVSVPVTADLEAGYGRRPEDAAATARGAVEAGAVGMNLEDWNPERGSLVEVPLQVERIAAAREAGSSAGIDLFVNARTDAFRAPQLPEGRRLDEAVRRAAAYRAAGADCVFFPFVQDGDTIARLARDVEPPINILAGPGVPSLSELERMGVRRVTLGSGIARAALGFVRRVAVDLRQRGSLAAVLEHAIPYAEIQDWFGWGESA